MDKPYSTSAAPRYAQRSKRAVAAARLVAYDRIVSHVRSELRARLEAESDAELRSITSPLRRGRSEPEAVALAREILVERGSFPTEPERCPRCHGANLEGGDARVHGTLAGFLLVKLSLQHLWFRPDRGGEEQIVAKSLERRPAIRCRDCGTLILEP